jgi:endonuclease/exonuclease/phosphatase family metal-dependent hydrolase
MFKRLQLHYAMILEAGLIGLFFVQALRALISALYSQVAGASIVSALQLAGAALPDPLPIDPAAVSANMSTLGALLALPVAAMFFVPLGIMPFIAALIVITGRLLMFDFGVMPPTAAAALTVCGGLIYLLTTARHRLRVLPYIFVLGFTADMIIRAFGDTVDLSLRPAWLNVQIVLSAAAALLALIGVLGRSRSGVPAADRGLIPLWGAIGIAGSLYLWLALFGLPNAAASRAGVDYALFTPVLVAAALLPIIPAVRAAARGFIVAFDAAARGWLWLLLLALLLTIGLRLDGIIGGSALVAAAFIASLLWWWAARPKGERERSLGGIWLLIGVGMFALLLLGDNFTYEYAFVRDFTGELAFLNPYIPPLLRGFRGFGLGVLIFAALLAAMPMIQTRSRLPWAAGAPPLVSFLLFIVGGGVVAAAAYAVSPPTIQGVRDVESLRIATYNIHGGYDEFFVDQREALLTTIRQSGANVVLLQEADAGRLASGGVDHSLWLARRLGMDRRYYGTNERLHGLAVLSNVPIVFADGLLLDSLGSQTGAQRVQIAPDASTVITVYNVWLSPLFDVAEGGVAAGERDQQQQLNTVFETLIGRTCDAQLGRAVLGGTFHNVPDSPLIAALRSAGFSDPFAGLPLERAATFVRFAQPRARFDYLWLCNLPSEGVGVLSDSSASDHRIAYVGVRLR